MTTAGQTLQKTSSFSPQQLSTTAWAYAAMAIIYVPLLDSLSCVATLKISEFNPQALANTAWALAVCSVTNTSLFSSISEVSLRTFAEFQVQAIANMVWAWSTLAMDDQPLFASLAAAAHDKLHQFAVQNLANTAWAFAVGNMPDKTIVEAIAAESTSRIERILGGSLLSMSTSASVLQELCTFILSVAWSLGFSSLLSEDQYQCFEEALARLGSCLDRDYTVTAVTNEELGHRILATFSQKPSVISKLNGMAVIHKPADWEDDGPTTDAGCHLHLSGFLRQQFSNSECPLVFDMQQGFGFLHRLDVPSSGLVLCGTNFVGYDCLRLQLDTHRLQREYTVLGHGVAPSSLSRIIAKIDIASDPTQRKSISASGRPSETMLRVAAHLERLHLPTKDVMFLTGIRISTGRRHQIRAHMRHIGHPSVVDARYACKEVFLGDIFPDSPDAAMKFSTLKTVAEEEMAAAEMYMLLCLW
eukprot:TRINITY_DN3849_c0_g1_i10.p1 TRINITY_DN3849_c0_g1~~TRINITY_DN3849_c0_g1_i10.p1  ORF type:complete len:473 (+),score=81.38 TRINITY_DN3849_c0_g1_i10:818-2236(+)